MLKLVIKGGGFLVFDYFTSIFINKKLRITFISLFLILIIFIGILNKNLFILFIFLYLLIYLIKLFNDFRYKNNLKKNLSLRLKINNDSNKYLESLNNKKKIICFRLLFLNYYSLSKAIKIFKYSIFKKQFNNLLNIYYDINSKEIKVFLEKSNNIKDENEQIFSIIKIIHSKNFSNLNIKILNENENKFITFEKIKYYEYRGLLFTIARDKDILKFNSSFDLTSHKKVFRDVIFDIQTQLKKFKFLYSTAYLGYGLNVGKPWYISHGIGRWIYKLEQHVSPLIYNKKVLDLGSNTGVLPIIMLMAGAKEVVGIELDKLNYQTSIIYQRAAEWNLNKDLNLKMMNKNMMEVTKWNNEYFDVVSLYCSIYYLNKNEIKELMNWIKKYSKKVIIEANQASTVSGRKEKADISYLKKILIENNFNIIAEDNQKNSLRPYIIAAV